MAMESRLLDVEAGTKDAQLTAEPGDGPLRGLTFFVIVGLVVMLVTLRIQFMLRRPRQHPRSPGTPVHLMVILGSGGHTAEMLSILRNLDTSKYGHRTYVVSSGDDFSVKLALGFEADIKANEESKTLTHSKFRIVKVPRARKIHQSLFTTPWSSLACLFFSLWILRYPWPVPVPDGLTDEEWHALVKQRPKTGVPDAILTNGPATGVIMVLASYIFRFLALSGSKNRLRVVYVESWARVRRLSLSGKILLRLADRFLVQWEGLKAATGSKGEFIGTLVN